MSKFKATVQQRSSRKSLYFWTFWKYILKLNSGLPSGYSISSLQYSRRELARILRGSSLIFVSGQINLSLDWNMGNSETERSCEGMIRLGKIWSSWFDSQWSTISNDQCFIMLLLLKRRERVVLISSSHSCEGTQCFRNCKIPTRKRAVIFVGSLYQNSLLLIRAYC